VILSSSPRLRAISTAIAATRRQCASVPDIGAGSLFSENATPAITALLALLIGIIRTALHSQMCAAPHSLAAALSAVSAALSTCAMLGCYTSAMPEKKPAIGVTHAVIDGKPRVMIALYLDHPSVQVTKDDEGRPIALAAMEPGAAYNTLATRIIEAYDRAVQGAEL
jgi:hypothetical protein